MKFKDGDKAQLAIASQQGYEKYYGMEGVVEGEARVRIRYPNGKTIYPFVKEVVKIEKEATMKFSIGDRVEVVGSPDDYRYYKKGDTGTIDSEICSNGFNGIITDSHRVRLDSPKHKIIRNPLIRVKDIKLITKGNDMEIEVGQVWEYYRGTLSGISVTIIKPDYDVHEQGGQRFLGLWSNDDEECCETIESLLKDAKLITNIKGDNKMEKKITPKGKNIKVDDYIYDRHCSNTGIVTALTKEHCVYDDCDTGEEHFRKYEYITLMINKPKKVVKNKK